MHERLPAQPDSVARLRRCVVDFAGANGATDLQRENIALAVSEAVSNAVLHAYAGQDQPGVIDVRASLTDGALVVVIRDEGIGLVPRADSPGLGIGLAVIAQVTEHFEMVDAMPGLCVRMTLAIA